jgi:transcriptional regulator with XRE-family HTH domain
MQSRRFHGFLPSELDREFLLVFSQVVTEKLRAETSDSQARQSLRDLLTRLELSAKDLSRILGVSPEDVDAWESDRIPIRAEHSAVLNHASSAANRLSALFRAERLPQVIRRSTALFGGESALDWILQGRVDEVVNRYEAALAYQS